MKLQYFVLSSVLSMFVCGIYAMDVVKTIEVVPEVIAAPIKKWPLYLYGETFPGIAGDPDIMQEHADTLIEAGTFITKEMADMMNMHVLQRAATDWAHALHEVEKQGLLCKPFEIFTLDDIKKIASWLKRSTEENPERFRTSAPEHPTITAPENIELKLREFLQDIQAFITVLKKFPKERHKRIPAILDVAYRIHQAMLEIQPCEHGNDHLGRMLANIFLAQYGMEPLTFYSGTLHTEKLRALVFKGDKKGFKEYVHKTYFTNERMRKNPRCFEIMKAVVNGTALEGYAWYEAMLNHPFQKTFEATVEVRRAAVERVTARQNENLSEAKKCAQCDKDYPSQRCSACRAVFYCSQKCQAVHWKTHKLNCVKVDATKKKK